MRRSNARAGLSGNAEYVEEGVEEALANVEKSQSNQTKLANNVMAASRTSRTVVGVRTPNEELANEKFVNCAVLKSTSRATMSGQVSATTTAQLTSGTRHRSGSVQRRTALCSTIAPSRTTVQIV